MARPIEYDPKIVEDVNEYIDSCEDEIENVVSQESEKYTMYKQRLKVKLPSIEGLALHLQISKDTIYRWEELYPEFSDVINTLRAKQAVKLLNSGLSGEYNPFIAKAILSKHGYSEKTEIDQNTKHSGGIEIKWSEPIPDSKDKGSSK